MPIGFPGVPQRSQDMLDFLVVGGGIAGLACAYSLQDAGHQVTVLEDGDGSYKSHGVVRSPPNMTRLLDYWGLGEALSRISIKATQFECHIGATGDHLASVALHDNLINALPGDFCYVQHAELHTMLYNVAKEAGVKIQHNTKVVSVDPWAGTVTTSNGAKMSADIIIGADGYKSVVRPVVVGPQALNGVRDDWVSINFVVPIDKMKQHQDLAPFVESAEWTFWYADNASLWGVRAGNSQFYAISMHIPREGCVQGNWGEEYPIKKESLKLHLFEPRVQKLAQLAETMTVFEFTHFEPFDNWVHESGKVVLVGEAAHPIVPNVSHNAAMGIEDAMTLSLLFALPSTRSQTLMLFTAYEELRQQRCADMQLTERQKRDYSTIPLGQQQRARDEGYRTSQMSLADWEKMNGTLGGIFSEFINLTNFDACEAVEDWWTKWGPAMRNPSAHAVPDDSSDTPTSEPLLLDTELVREESSHRALSDILADRCTVSGR
ncbi:hypothetical protein PAXRUDRAFT_139046 [Paxillus rubicundulus Ve08.2h10]|uniref:Unplaced genomic scaffold scaffold_178, whole genome shotgun sequence n=1 Tax=Paxillus rubicundulus Ve08.2h10 TaxID=930991 RepID=A0A0D0DEZ5_9AGAM|nr:hypothetical protein PAXRUDRAFT_139046 [Paxillus rubicundulus Ve08.2h10]